MMLLKTNNSRKIGLIIGLGFVISFCIILFRSEYKMRKYKISCAQCIGVSRVKSSWYYTLEYQIGDSLYVSTRQGKNYNQRIANYLDTVSCVKIAYYQLDIGFVRILDKKVADEWLWFLNE